MLIVGIIMLIKLRRPAPAADVLLADDLQLMHGDDACVIPAEEEAEASEAPGECQEMQEPENSEDEA
jgi:hypothetical protein